MQTEMGGKYAKHVIADQNIGIDRAARLVAGDGKINRARREHRKAGQNRVAESPAMSADAGTGDDLATRGLAEISPLVRIVIDASAGVYLLQASDVCGDLAQHGTDAARIVAPVNADAGMNVVGDDSDRGGLLR